MGKPQKNCISILSLIPRIVSALAQSYRARKTEIEKAIAGKLIIIQN